jgi:hypothetical protein
MFCCEYDKNLQSFFKGANHSHICSALEPIKDHVHKSSQLEQKILLCCNKKSDFFGTWPKKNKSTLSFFCCRKQTSDPDFSGYIVSNT